ncbi:MAG: tetratricopeptide repeat protein [Spirochaetaceae bacterium]|nr:MAG: tetratricopeptide repeat protein [Spirochaetaceae bacterium]
MSDMNEQQKQSADQSPEETGVDGFIDQEVYDEQQQRLAELSKTGYQFLKENLIDQALSCFQEILNEEPDNNYALVGMGDCLRRQKQFSEAVGYYQRCLDRYPDNNYALFGLADCYRTMRHYNKAIAAWEEYLKYDNENVTVLTRVADAHRKARNFERSKELYVSVLEIEADNAYALIGLGHLHYDFRKHKEALAYWKRMHELHGASVDIRVLTSIGNCYRKLKNFEQGVAYFQEALDREPGNFYALFGLADCYRGMNEAEQSLDAWNQILAKDPKNKVILTRAGDALRSLGRNEEAEIYYTRALNIEFDLYAVFGLAMIAKDTGRSEDALRSLERLLPADPQNHRLYIEAAECLLSLGRRHEAVEMLERFSRQGIRNRYVSDMISRLTREQP